MAHPLARQLAPIIDQSLEELHRHVAAWVLSEDDSFERQRYRSFGADLRAVKERISRRQAPPSEEEVEIALTALLALVGHRLRPSRGQRKRRSHSGLPGGEKLGRAAHRNG